MPVLNFSKNWNRKLDSDFYTTFRRRTPQFHKNEQYEVKVNGKFHHRAVCLKVTYLRLDQVNAFISHLDAGCDVETFQEIVTSVYANVTPDEEFILMLMKKIRK